MLDPAISYQLIRSDSQPQNITARVYIIMITIMNFCGPVPNTLCYSIGHKASLILFINFVDEQVITTMET